MCRAKRGIVANRVRRGTAVTVKSLPVPPWGEACHPCSRHRATRGAGTNAAVACRRRCTVWPLVFKQLVGRQAPMSQRSEFFCVLDHSRCDPLAWYSWPRRRARRVLPGKACRRHPELCGGRGAHPRQPDAEGAAAATVRSVPLPPWDKACRPCTWASNSGRDGCPCTNELC